MWNNASRLVEPADQTIGAECRQAFMDLIQRVYNVANKIPLDKMLNMIPQ